MTLPQIQNALQRLLYIHPLADTNIERIENLGADIVFQTDSTELDELRDELRDRQKEVDELEIQNDELRTNFRSAERKLAEIERVARTIL